jgi:peptide/nickel transport system permease protein
MTALALKMRRGWRPGSVPLLVGGILTALLIAIALTSLVWTPAAPTSSGATSPRC